MGAGVGRWEARLFGAFRLLAPDGVDATPTGRKARALVAYLLASTDDGRTRERLAGMLWSERSDDQARTSLRQTIHEMRGLVSGDEPLLAAERTRVSIVASRATTDVARLDAAARADDLVALLALVGEHPSEFLADLDGIDPAFDDWLSIERTRRRDARRRAVLAVADRRLERDDPDAARQLADRLLAGDPTDEAAARIAIQASHRQGDRDAARRHFSSVADALRRLVGVEPSKETEEVYRRALAAPRTSTAPLRVPPGEGGDTHDALPVPEEAVAPVAPPDDALAAVRDAPDVAVVPPSARRTRRWTIYAAAVALIAVAAVELVGWRNARNTTTRRVFLVEPIRVASGDADASVLRNGFSAELASVLVGKPEFIVRDNDRVADHSVDRSTAFAADQPFVVAAEARSHDGMLHASLRLLANRDGPIVWSTTLARPVEEVDAFREQLAAKIADVADCALDGRHTDLRAFHPDTLQLLLGACDLRHTDWAEATKLLQQLTREVPRYGHGWALLAIASAGDSDPPATNVEGAPARIASYARRAIELDPHDGDAWIAQAAQFPGMERWPQRVALLREGLAVEPDNAHLADALAETFAEAGYVEQALSWSEGAIRENPFSPSTAARHARLLGLRAISHGPEATAAFLAARRRFGADRTLALAEFRYQALVGDHRRALEMLGDPKWGVRFHPDRAAMWKALLTTRADPTAAHDAEADRAFAAALHAIPDINLWTLETLSVLHRVDEAYADVDRLRPQAVDDDVADSLFGPANRPLRADPRFMTLAARLGLAALWHTTDRWPDFCSEPDLGYDCRVEAARALSGDPRPLVARR